MNDEKSYTLAEAHTHFAKSLNGKTWELLDKTDRTAEENERMLYTAHASCYHWLHAGAGVNHHRGEWLIARVHTVLGHAEEALRHAARSMELFETHRAETADFDLAFAHEGLARAQALAGNKDEAQRHYQLAEAAGRQIADKEDREVFFADFNSGNWYGLRG
jgi:tetratricopeptide (TPR) repeat protein